MSSKLTYLSMYQDYLILKNYSPRTVESYLRFGREFLDYCGRHKNLSLTYEDYARKYLLSLQKKGFCWTTINVYYSSLKLLCLKVFRKDWNVENLPRPRMPKTLPRILSIEEVIRLIESPRSLKHRIIILLMYSTGLRISEVLQLKIIDIDSNRLEIYVNQGKGQKDRMVAIPSKLLKLLREYYKKYHPKEYLFEGQGSTRQYSASSIRAILIRAQKNAKISKRVSPHTLRHCYATHHLECGTDIVFLKEQLGHTNLKTTARYIHLCRTRNRYIHHPIEQVAINIL